jgi:hypothetical protein
VTRLLTVETSDAPLEGAGVEEDEAAAFCCLGFWRGLTGVNLFKDTGPERRDSSFRIRSMSVRGLRVLGLPTARMVPAMAEKDGGRASKMMNASCMSFTDIPPTGEMLADGLTKSLPRASFDLMVNGLGFANERKTRKAM